MKKLTCEMCGGTDLIKDGGVFVCQTCGCKYSVEEAKKMMVEGTVSVEGTVNIDNSAFVKKYLENARRAKEKEDWEETEKYYNLVEQNDPENFEAIFYSAYGKAKSSLVVNDIYKRQSIFNVLNNCLCSVFEKYDSGDAEEEKEIIANIALDVRRMLMAEFVYTEWKNGYGVVTRTNQNDTYQLFVNLANTFHKVITAIIQNKEDRPYLHQVLIDLYNLLVQLDYVSDGMKQDCRRRINEQKEQKEKIYKERNNAYWGNHLEEKNILEEKKAFLEKQIEELNKQIDALPESMELTAINKEIEHLKEKKENLGIFKVKEKKILQKNIEEKNSKADTLKKKQEVASEPIRIQREPVQNKLKEVIYELEKER